MQFPQNGLDNNKMIELGRAVITTEMKAVADLVARIDDRFVAACQAILSCTGRTVVTGMGKSGHMGSKIAATLASTGTPAFFVHPGEASHGDFGMITSQDVVIAISNSGETDEIVTLLPMIKRLNIPLIALTGNPGSVLAEAATVCIDVSVAQEACPFGLAPTASTTAALAMGDAIAIALLEARGFSADDFARAHPGGTMGRRLLLHVGDIMHTGDEMPCVQKDTLLSKTLVVMTQKGLGTVAIIDHDRHVIGIFTDGDVRRSLDSGADVHTTIVGDVMTENCKTVTHDCLAASALAIMEKHKINALLVGDEQRKLVGVLNMHDLLRARSI